MSFKVRDLWLTPGGLFLVRETHAPTPATIAFNTVMDEIFYAALHDNHYLSPKFNFQGAAAWQALFRQTGFEIVKTDRRESRQPFGQTWFLLRKHG